MRIDDAKLALPGEAALAQHVPTLAIPAAVLGDVRGLCVQRKVRGRVAKVKEERRLPVALKMIFEKADGIVAEGIRDVVIGARPDRLPFEVQQLRLEVVAAAAGAIEAVEPAVKRKVLRQGSVWLLCTGTRRIDPADVPFADVVASIACFVKQLRDRRAAIVQADGIAGPAPILTHVADACLVRIEPRQERRAGGAAAGAVVELGEAEAVRRETIQIRRGDFRSVAAEIRKTEIVRKNKKDVRPVRRVGCLDRRFPTERGRSDQEQQDCRNRSHQTPTFAAHFAHADIESYRHPEESLRVWP